MNLSNIYIPQYLYLVLTTACNLRCKQCFLWEIERPEKTLNLGLKIRTIEEFHKINPNGRIILTGGEPLLLEDDFFSITQVCRKNNLVCVANTNGTMNNITTIERLCRNGPDILVVSLDSHLSSIHDFVRGLDGTFTKVIDFITSIVELKKKLQCGPKVIIHSMIFEKNYAKLSLLVEFARALKVDAIEFQLLSPSFAIRDREDKFYADFSCQNRIEAASKIEDFKNKYKEDPFVLTNQQTFDLIISMLLNKLNMNNICDSHKKNIMIDMKGELQLCFNMRSLSGGESLGNLCDKNLKTLLTSQLASHMHNVMKNCSKTCGLLSCHRQNGEPF